MKKLKAKQLVPCITVVLLSASLLAACGKDAQESSDATSTGPKDLSILLSHNLGPYAMQYKGDDDVYTQALSKLSGYNLHYIFLGHNQEYVQQLTVRFASKDLADMVETDDALNSVIHPGAVEQGIFHQLNNLLDKYGPDIKKNIPQAVWDSPRISKDGKIYGIPSLSGAPANRVVYMRQDWLDKLNMPQPKTVDDYLKFFEAVKVQDMNGNGDPNDEYGFYVRENLDYSEMFFKEFGAHPKEWMYRDGKLQAGLIQPEMKDALKFWKMLYDKGYINPNLFTNKSSDWRAGIKQGKAGIWLHDVQNYQQDWAPELFVNEKNVKISLLEGPQGPKGKGLTLEGDRIKDVWVIPTSNKNPEEVIKYLNWAWSSPEADKFFAYGIEGRNYTVGTDGKIVFDAKSQANTEIGQVRLTINPRQEGRLSPLVLAIDPNANLLKAGLQAAQNSIYKNDGLYMPNLDALKTHPELGSGAGTLFLDMFAKVVTGKAELDATFDQFVKDWKARGGDAAIAEATKWYKAFHHIQ
ncbi:extracellular solute-binding protein [Paenibacillus koleovorans]|uniref:extracellular solute-binding protein n=1 Tax=Paenibacillus koleovorans TaxID=121608 RepID=UPI000FD7D9E4|nr:extracellular solute-binding protein [Paenibacillus koleovorans]